MTSSSGTGARSAFTRLVGANPKAADWIAMGMYAQLEQEWAAQDQVTNGVAPTPAQIAAYASARLTPQIEQSLRMTAANALSVYAGQIVADAAPRIVSAHCAGLEGKIERLRAEIAKSTFWKDVKAGVAGAFIYSALLIGLSILVAFTKPDLLEVPKAVIDKLAPPHAEGK